MRIVCVALCVSRLCIRPRIQTWTTSVRSPLSASSPIRWPTAGSWRHRHRPPSAIYDRWLTTHWHSIVLWLRCGIAIVLHRPLVECSWVIQWWYWASYSGFPPVTPLEEKINNRCININFWHYYFGTLSTEERRIEQYEVIYFTVVD